MSGDDMTPEMKNILNILHNTKDREMEVTDIARSVELRLQELEHFIEKLKSMGLVEIYFERGYPEKFCALTDAGRKYVMEKLRR